MLGDVRIRAVVAFEFSMTTFGLGGRFRIHSAIIVAGIIVFSQSWRSAPRKSLSEQHADRHGRHEEWRFNSERLGLASAGAGQNPPKPQPRPKIAAPMIRRRSIGDDAAEGDFRIVPKRHKISIPSP